MTDHDLENAITQIIALIPNKRTDTRGNSQNGLNPKFLTRNATGFNEAIDEVNKNFGVGL